LNFFDYDASASFNRFHMTRFSDAISGLRGHFPSPHFTCVC
jgi:hypothetical protein